MRTVHLSLLIKQDGNYNSEALTHVRLSVKLDLPNSVCIRVCAAEVESGDVSLFLLLPLSAVATQIIGSKIFPVRSKPRSRTTFVPLILKLDEMAAVCMSSKVVAAPRVASSRREIQPFPQLDHLQL